MKEGTQFEPERPREGDIRTIERDGQEVIQRYIDGKWQDLLVQSVSVRRGSE